MLLRTPYSSCVSEVPIVFYAQQWSRKAWECTSSTRYMYFPLRLRVNPKKTSLMQPLCSMKLPDQSRRWNHPTFLACFHPTLNTFLHALALASTGSPSCIALSLVLLSAPTVRRDFHGTTRDHPSNADPTGDRTTEQVQVQVAKYMLGMLGVMLWGRRLLR